MEEQTPKDWENVRFRPRSRFAAGSPDDNASARFSIAIVVFVLVALAYPWYSYWVQSRLIARDIQAATTQLNSEALAAMKGLNQQLTNERERQVALAERRNISSVRVVGASVSQGMPVVIVQLGDASLPAVTATICQQASGWLGQSTAGMTLRVQRHRGGVPAIDAGRVRC